METILTLPAIFERTLKSFGDRIAYSFSDENPETYNQIADRVRSVIFFLEQNGIRKGDRVAILSLNMPNWAVAFHAITFMGAVAVPVLPDFSPIEIKNVLEHSESKAVFVSSTLSQKLENFRPGNFKIISIENFSFVSHGDGSAEYKSADHWKGAYYVEEEDLASIIYTSGTTGKSKGVMLTHKNIVINAIQGSKVQPIDENDRFLSVLPLSHTYENTLGLVLPILFGSSVYYLRKPPTPAVLLPALEKIRPTMMLTVPLIIEKIYFNKILPSIQESKLISRLYRVPFLRKKINAAAGKKLLKTFGGNLKFFGIGGAKLNPAVEKFLIEAKFPYAIGYGLTETAPLLAGSNPTSTVFESTGPPVENVELIIHDPDKNTGEGEIWARGPNIMKGYYLEPELTSQVITPDGWFRTGDLGVFDSRNNLYIKGRLKNMILGSSGENIYPEEIESIINNSGFVVESLVLEQKGKLVALVHLNMEELEKKYRTLKEDMAEKKEELVREIKTYVNSHLNKFSQIHKVIIHPEPFQKTATLKIKRFLYSGQ